jgi:hypothetical protein
VKYTYLIEVEAERTEGKFASRDEIGELITEELESANPEQVSGSEGGEYEISTWEVTEQPQGKAAKK